MNRTGWKKKRNDPLSKTIPTKLYNWVTRLFSGISLHDFNCGLKAYNYEVVKNLEVYGEMHRYIPLLAKSEGFGNITEKAASETGLPKGIPVTTGTIDAAAEAISIGLTNQGDTMCMYG